MVPEIFSSGNFQEGIILNLSLVHRVHLLGLVKRRVIFRPRTIIVEI